MRARPPRVSRHHDEASAMKPIDDDVVLQRVTSPLDIDDVMSIEAEAFINPWTREMHEADFANTDVSHLVVARDARGYALGFCAFWIVLDELHVNNLAVRPLHRRNGIGSRLVAFVLDEGRDRGTVRATLEVRRSNEAAIRLYTRWGFVVSAVRRGYYTQPNEDALILWRDAPAPRWPGTA